MKTLKILFIFVLIFFPIGEILRLDLANNIVLKPLDIIIGLTVAWWLFLTVKKNQKIKNLFLHKFIPPILIFSFVGLFSLIINTYWLKPNEFFVSLLYLVRWISYALLFPIVLQFDKDFKKKIALILFIDGLFFVAFGYFQYFLYNSLKNLLYLGWDEHMHRIFSTFFDPNFAGAFFVLFFIFVCGKIYSHLKNKQYKKGFVFGFILLFTLIAILFTYSRSTFLMLIIGLITFLTFINKKKLVFFVLATIVVFALITSPKYYDENMNLFRKNSVGARIANYADAVTIIKDKPILGVGFNTYRYAKQYYGIRTGWLNNPSHADAGVDNSFLFVLATTGVIGLSVYLWLWVVIMKRALSLYKKQTNTMAIVVFSSSTGLFVDAFFINSLFFAPIMVWMWVMIGLMWDN